jgi:hypothetical protein
MKKRLEGNSYVTIINSSKEELLLHESVVNRKLHYSENEKLTKLLRKHSKNILFVMQRKELGYEEKIVEIAYTMFYNSSDNKESSIPFFIRENSNIRIMKALNEEEKKIVRKLKKVIQKYQVIGY